MNAWLEIVSHRRWHKQIGAWILLWMRPEQGLGPRTCKRHLVPNRHLVMKLSHQSPVDCRMGAVSVTLGLTVWYKAMHSRRLPM